MDSCFLWRPVLLKSAPQRPSPFYIRRSWTDHNLQTTQHHVAVTVTERSFSLVHFTLAVNRTRDPACMTGSTTTSKEN